MRKGRILVLFCFLLLLIDVIGMKWYCDLKINLIKVPIAAVDIHARSKISENMIAYIEIPAAYVHEAAYLMTEDILGKYTELGNKIEKGSPFYIGNLFYEGELPDAPSLKLKKGQTAFTLPVDLVKLSGNSITVDQKVDLYVAIDQTQAAPVVDNLLKAVRVVSVKDRNGIDVQDDASSHVPYVAVLAVNDDQINYLKIAQRIGEIDILAPSQNYSHLEESILNEQSSVLKWLK